MRFTFSVIAFVASLAFVSAQDLEGVPSCAIPCFAAAVPASGCDITDTKCQCTTGRESIEKSITACATSKCLSDDIIALAQAVQNICSRAGVSVTVNPTAISAAIASGGGSTTATRTASGSGSASGATNAPAQSTGGAAASHVACVGMVAMGIAAGVLGL